MVDFEALVDLVVVEVVVVSVEEVVVSVGVVVAKLLQKKKTKS